MAIRSSSASWYAHLLQLHCRICPHNILHNLHLRPPRARINPGLLCEPPGANVSPPKPHLSLRLFRHIHLDIFLKSSLSPLASNSPLNSPILTCRLHPVGIVYYIFASLPPSRARLRPHSGYLTDDGTPAYVRWTKLYFANYMFRQWASIVSLLTAASSRASYSRLT